MGNLLTIPTGWRTRKFVPLCKRELKETHFKRVGYWSERVLEILIVTIIIVFGDTCLKHPPYPFIVAISEV